MKIDIRHDWSFEEVMPLFNMPFNDLIFKSHSIHRECFDQNEVQLCTLVNIKEAGCPEDCKYCAQSMKYNTGLKPAKLMSKEDIMTMGKKAKEKGATRLCMGAAWREVKDRDVDKIKDIIQEVRSLGLETCMTLGMITKQEHADQFKEAGLDYYNHNIDTSAKFYPSIVATRNYEDRLKTLEFVKNADIKVCSGVIIGMGEEVDDRAEMLITLANLAEHPLSVPINRLVKIPGTPLENVKDLDNFEFIRTIAVARIIMPKSYVRLSAGRYCMNEEMQSLCFFAGANSIFYGDKMLTTPNKEANTDMELFKKLHIKTTELVNV